ncbi:hypothetical protein HK405_014477 [Cladochytrium tenue]|nr:hypothetical protein HK405_014477 [Cladochytrium tenue]
MDSSPPASTSDALDGCGSTCLSDWVEEDCELDDGAIVASIDPELGSMLTGLSATADNETDNSCDLSSLLPASDEAEDLPSLFPADDGCDCDDASGLCAAGLLFAPPLLAGAQRLPLAADAIQIPLHIGGSDSDDSDSGCSRGAGGDGDDAAEADAEDGGVESTAASTAAESLGMWLQSRPVAAADAAATATAAVPHSARQPSTCRDTIPVATTSFGAFGIRPRPLPTPSASPTQQELHQQGRRGGRGGRRARPSDPAAVLAELDARRQRNTESARRSRQRRLALIDSLRASIDEARRERDDALRRAAALEAALARTRALVADAGSRLPDGSFWDWHQQYRGGPPPPGAAAAGGGQSACAA